MKMFKLALGIIVVGLIFVPSTAFSNGYTTPWIGGELQGPAVASGAGVYWNPASIGDIDSNSLFITIEPTYMAVSYKPAGFDQNGVPYNKVSFQSWAPLPTLAATFKLPAGFSAGLGVYAPFARTANFPLNGPERYNGASVFMLFGSITPVLTYKIIPSLIIGAGFNYNIGYLDEKQSLSIDFANPGDQSPLAEAKVHLKNNIGTTYGWTAGIYYKPTYNFTAGISYIARTYYTLDGTADITNPTLGSVTAKTKMYISMPQMINIGLHFLPTPDWIVDITEQWINWSEYKTIHVKLYDASSPLVYPDSLSSSRDMDILTGFDDVLNSKLWVGYKGFKDWLLAGGVTYDPSGIPLNNIYSLNLEFNKMEVFGEADYSISPSTTIGLGYDHNFTQDAQVTDSASVPSSNGVYKADIEKITLLLNYKF